MVFLPMQRIEIFRNSHFVSAGGLGWRSKDYYAFLKFEVKH